VRLIVVLLLTGCGRIAFDPLGGDGGSAGDGGGDGSVPLVCGAWSSTATRLDALCTVEQDWEPAIHPNGTLLLFTSTRLMPGTSMEIYMTTRAGNTFSTPSVVTALSTVGAAFDGGPAWTAAGDELTFSSDRANGRRLYRSAYSNGVFGAPTMISELANQPANAPTLRADGLELYFDDYGGTTSAAHIFRATRASTTSPWGAVAMQTQLDPGGTYGWPALSPDALTLYYEGPSGMYEATRASTSDAFGPGTLMPGFDPGIMGAGDPDFSWDSQTLFFASTRVSNPQAADLFMVTRTCN
jgi:hypothetical protein